MYTRRGTYPGILGGIYSRVYYTHHGTHLGRQGGIYRVKPTYKGRLGKHIPGLYTPGRLGRTIYPGYTHQGG